MTVEAKMVLEKALTLPPVERAELVEQILSSFEFPSSGDIDALWKKEAEARINAYDQSLSITSINVQARGNPDSRRR